MVTAKPESESPIDNWVWIFEAWCREHGKARRLYMSGLFVRFGDSQIIRERMQNPFVLAKDLVCPDCQTPWPNMTRHIAKQYPEGGYYPIGSKIWLRGTNHEGGKVSRIIRKNLWNWP